MANPVAFDFLDKSGEGRRVRVLFEEMARLGEHAWDDGNLALQLALYGRILQCIGMVGILRSDPEDYAKYTYAMATVDNDLIDSMMQTGGYPSREEVEKAMYVAFRVGRYRDAE